jgi:Fe-S cluster assembly ATP-binding protein
LSQLEIKDLHASIEGKEILKGVDFQVKQGEIHAVMGPNGSGKSTLASTIMGHPKYQLRRTNAAELGAGRTG